MQTITKVTNVYKFDELSEDAKETARDWARGIDDLYGWHDDNVQSLKEFAKWVQGKADYSISLVGYSSAKVRISGYHDSIWNSETEEEEDILLEEISGDVLLHWLNDNIETIKSEGGCPFTGYCMDEDLLDPMQEYLAKSDPDDPRTLQDLVNDGCERWVKQYVADWESTYEDEQIDDFLSANDYDFLEDGSKY